MRKIVIILFLMVSSPDKYLVLYPKYNILDFPQGIRFKSYLVPPAYSNGIELWFCKYLVSRIPIICEQHYRDYMCRCRAYKAQVLPFLSFPFSFSHFYSLVFCCNINPIEIDVVFAVPYKVRTSISMIIPHCLY